MFITTGRFTSGAIEYAERDARARVVLVDGDQLVALMLKYRVGFQLKTTFEVVRIDEDFFA